MADPGVPPGPDAHRAFRLGMVAAAIVALLPLGALFWSGALSIELVAFVLIVGFPIYLLYVASLLSVWLGFNKGPTDLRPVRREQPRDPLRGR